MKISVITITYNAEATVERTLRSVASQRLCDSVGEYTAEYSQGRQHEVEHRVIDGASRDDTMGVVRQFGHVLWQSEPDDGIYDAMNKGLLRATGDYVVFLNAGDTLHDPLTLQHVFDAMQEKPVSPGEKGGAHANRLPAVIYGQTQWVNDEGHFVEMRNHWAPERLTSRSFLHGMLVCHQAFYARTDLARQEMYDTRWRFSADYDWCIRIIRRAERESLPTANTHYILANYLSEGMTTQNHATSLRERLYIMAHHYGWIAALWQHACLVVKQVF